MQQLLWKLKRCLLKPAGLSGITTDSKKAFIQHSFSKPEALRKPLICEELFFMVTINLKIWFKKHKIKGHPL
jgi:hypothetical protein